ncbi:SIS domain-containing protein [uncultured Desulfosarcina sp.]|uniref:SIS domain-containing protein n=1 Tax=uncultured Desulfosarcina sp. TaxID=218289 RepID=UPI0029C942ED|nr:SIS domain-containing protein [uncultured Desulfosarcina sp.]
MNPIHIATVASHAACIVERTSRLIRNIRSRFLRSPSIYWGRHTANVAGPAVILFPCSVNRLCCGLAGIIAVKSKADGHIKFDLSSMAALVDTAATAGLETRFPGMDTSADGYLGGQATLDTLLANIRTLKQETAFLTLFKDPAAQKTVADLSGRLSTVLQREQALLTRQVGSLAPQVVDVVSTRIEALKDMIWCLDVELAGNIGRIRSLMSGSAGQGPDSRITVLRQINAVLNSIDRLEVRGRDSAGISILFILPADAYETLAAELDRKGLTADFERRMDREVLENTSISMNRSATDNGQAIVALTVVYKIAAEIGSLGDNIRFLRRQIQQDDILMQIAAAPHTFHTVSSHTRWASVGAITEPNCHPVDNTLSGATLKDRPIIHACLNGDIDNYQELKAAMEAAGETIPEPITTDTKIIPLQIEHYLKTGGGVAEAFRLAVSDFQGSHAISMHTDLAPGKFFLAQKGSGQAVFVGLAEDHYMPASEVYGFIEETSRFLKMNGEKVVDGKKGPTQGQIFILDQHSSGGLAGITAMYYDGTPIQLSDDDVKHTEITSRDIDRQEHPHYFLKEISEAPQSVERTLLNRWKITGDGRHYVIHLDEHTFPRSLEEAFREDRIRRVFFVGQGTAGVAAQACADILKSYLADPAIQLRALKASELSGFELNEGDANTSMADALVVAISQSGTTTDTNRTVDMVKARGAHTLAIVNRRDSDITFKVDGVLYTSSGRDIEMSVASTKAFYSQIVAGALLGLKVAGIKGRRSTEFLSDQIAELLSIPDHMRTVLALGNQIQASARRLAATKTYWAAVGSGPNKSSADEIRIKLSELCYKTISSDFVEDKKHIDLSSEPLIIVCAAGSKGTVIGDIIKDTAIFKAHKAAPVVIADEGEERFQPYADDVFHVPRVSPQFAPILNTLVGHIWGYHAALAIHEGSRFLHGVRESIHNTLEDLAGQGLDIYEVVLEKSFREKIAGFYQAFRARRKAEQFPTAITHASDLTLLFKYLSGRLPLSDFEIDFGLKGTAKNILDTLFRVLGESINLMSRPVDAIKHQAKTVTVGTSRISERVEGILFETLAGHELDLSQVLNRNIIVMKNIQDVIDHVKGSILYRIDGLGLLGDPTDQTTIAILKKTGILARLSSRVESDPVLKGTKRIIVSEGNVYIGKGRKDGRSIVVIPATSKDPADGSRIRYLLLLNIGFKETIPLKKKIKALGGKYEHIKNIVQENSVSWIDDYLNEVAVDDLFGQSAEKLAEAMVARHR